MPDTIKPDLKEQIDILKVEYISLLNDKDVLLEWGKPQLEALYATKIGGWQVKKLQAQLRIKALKMKIEKVRSAINTGAAIDITQIELDVAAKLAETEAKIMVEAAKIESAKQMLSHLASPERSSEIRQLFREMAKQLHPDVNTDLKEEQIQLWHQLKAAYENGDLEKLKAMRIVYEKELAATAAAEANLTEDQLTLRLNVFKEGIRSLQEQVIQIKSEFPFTIEANIKDDEWVENETAGLKAELQKLGAYEEELTLQYQQMISCL